MTLKNRISLWVSILFTMLFGTASILIYWFYSNFRQQEFNDRLEIKALTTLKLLASVSEIDQSIMRIIDKTSINKLYDEKTLIFDDNYKLLYSSIDDSKINWSLADLKFLKANKSFFRKQGNNEIYGVFFDSKPNNFFVLVSANDNYGNRKLVYLGYLLLFSCLSFTTICWLLTSFIVKKAILPLTVFHQKIKNINENKLDTRIASKNDKNEIDLIAIEFNFMMDRIENSYQKQKEFTAHASHELRTPLARITSQIENSILKDSINFDRNIFLNTILNDINHLTELISSLLILSKLESKRYENKKTYRIDEILFTAIENINKVYPEFKIIFEISDDENIDSFLEIKGNKNLLEIAMLNLLKNACTYSNNNQAKIVIESNKCNLILKIFNNGQTIGVEEQIKLFQPFMRGKNALKTQGFGLGLRIIQRILTLHKATITYHAPEKNLNLFQITFHF